MPDIKIYREPGKGSYKTPRRVLAFANEAGPKSFTLEVSGVVSKFIFEIPAWAVNATLTVENSDGVEIYNSGVKAGNQNLKIAADIDIDGVNTIKVTLSAAATGTAYVTIYVR